MTPEDLREMLNYISDYSLYAYSEGGKGGLSYHRGRTQNRNGGTGGKKDGKVTGLSHITF